MIRTFFSFYKPFAAYKYLIAFPFLSFKLRNSFSKSFTSNSISSGNNANAHGNAKPIHNAMTMISIANAGLPGLMFNIFIRTGGNNIGATGKNNERVVTVLYTANAPALFEMPTSLPLASRTVIPFCISSIRVNATFNPPALATAKYGINKPNDFNAGTRAIN